MGKDYSDYYIIPLSEYAVVRICYCRRCGATVILDEFSAESMDTHNRWHQEHDNA